jgi:hypothetical protein
MNPRIFLGLSYLLMGLAWLHMGLLVGPHKGLHYFVPLIQAVLSLVALASAFLIPRLPGLIVQMVSLILIAAANVVLTISSSTKANAFTATHGIQSLGLLIAAFYAVQWWFNSGASRFARKFALGWLIASIGALATLPLEFFGQGHPISHAQRPFAAANDGLLFIAYALASWAGGVCALTLKTPQTLPDDAP